MKTPSPTPRSERPKLQDQHSILVRLLGIFAAAALFRCLYHEQVTIRIELLWYDVWRGLYIRPMKPEDRSIHLYYCPIECVVIHIEKLIVPQR